jgi:hypothetical protein
VGLVDDAMYAWYTVTDDTTLTLAPTANIVIDKVYGLKFGGGGGGGGNVDDVEVNGVSVLNPVTKIAEITSYKEVTQAEYDALPSSKESDGVAYFVKDGGVTSVFSIVDGMVCITNEE